MRYINLMGGEKPYLLVRSRNNLGAETRITYTPSTAFYLADRAAGKAVGDATALSRCTSSSASRPTTGSAAILRNALRISPRLLRRNGARVPRLWDGGAARHRGTRHPDPERRISRSNEYRCRIRTCRRSSRRLVSYRRVPDGRQCYADLRRGILERTGSDAGSSCRNASAGLSAPLPIYRRTKSARRFARSKARCCDKRSTALDGTAAATCRIACPSATIP